MTEPVSTITCTLYPAVPSRLSGLLQRGCRAYQEGGVVTLANDYLAIDIPARQGVITAVRSGITGGKYALVGDQTGFAATVGEGDKVEWRACEEVEHPFTVTLNSQPEAAQVVLTTQAQGLTIRITYRIQKSRFWVERRIAVESGSPRLPFDRLIHGRLEVPGGEVRILELGKFDRPRLVTVEEGGLFAGVGWWFYSVSPEGVYQNADMAYVAPGRLESEPWYLGVFGREDGEPYHGWLWYKNFLEMRKATGDRQTSWSYWNAGWGQWGIDIDDPAAAPYIELMARLGVRGIAFGSGGEGKGIPRYLELARTSEVAQKHLRELRKRGITVGFLESGHLGEKWTDQDGIDRKVRQLDEYVGEGYGAFHFDFFSTVDTFTAHRNVTHYFRAARDRLDYTECHLGMADYGPQFQREVLVNHPNDIHGFDISHFSSDWATFLGFRHSRREWQNRYQYLMPEYGLYYFLTHYANWGHPRQYEDPEPQQFLYGPQAYCGLGYNFHDAFGFREALAAAAAFSPYYVLGHLELNLPEPEVRFARNWLAWVAGNADVLRRARVCLEDEAACVVSKVRDGQGAVFVVNYQPGKRTFRMKLTTGARTPLTIRPVYPVRQVPFQVRDGEEVEVEVRGESVAVLDVNQGLNSLPPQNPGVLRLDVADWQREEGGWVAHFTLPDPSASLRTGLAAARDPHLPRELVSLEQLEETDPVRKAADSTGAVGWLGRGPLPALFLQAYGFRDGQTVETWKIAPWAFADRVWLVYRPPRPPRLSDQWPEARVNGKTVPLVPRVDYRPAKPEDWTCSLFFADLTEVCQSCPERSRRNGRRNLVWLAEPDGSRPGACYVMAADRRQ